MRLPNGALYGLEGYTMLQGGQFLEYCDMITLSEHDQHELESLAVSTKSRSMISLNISVNHMSIGILIIYKYNRNYTLIALQRQ